MKTGVVLASLVLLLAVADLAKSSKAAHAVNDARKHRHEEEEMMRYQEDANKIEQEAYLEDAAEREEDDEDSVAEASYEMSKEEEKDYFKDAKDFHVECKYDQLGKKYRGAVSKTGEGVTCQRWDSQKPHRHLITPENNPGEGLTNNYCRNPDNEASGPWCYTMGRKRYDFCAIPLCSSIEHKKNCV